MPTSEYERNLDILEVQGSFYNPLSKNTLRKWKAHGIMFSIKAWQGITHNAKSPTYRRFRGTLRNPENYGFFRRTEEVEEAWRITEDMARTLGARFIILQSPASFRETEENIENVRYFLRKHGFSGKIGWEPRGQWSDDALRYIFDGSNAIHVTDPFVRMPVTDKIAYFRLHGSPPGKRMYSYRYTAKDMVFIRDSASVFDTAYVLFNNYSMKESALLFKSMFDH